MFEQTKRAIIVYRPQDDEYAHLMANLISAHTEYEVAVWAEKDWLANQATTSSSQKVIFLGNSKEAKKRHLGMAWIYNQHNMKFGWLGNQCVIDIASLSPDDFKPFCVYYQQMAIEHQTLNSQPILKLAGDVLSEDTLESSDVVAISTAISPEDDDTNDNSSEINLIPSEEQRFARLPAIFEKMPSLPKLDIAKLGSKAVAPITNQITSGKLIRFQFNLVIRVFVFSGELRNFMES